jgi:MFS family permease
MTDHTDSQTPVSYLPLFAVTFMVGVVMISLGPVLDPILKDLQIPLAQGGLISASLSVGMLIGLVALNFFLARLPVKWGLAGGTWLLAASLAASALLGRSLWSLFATYLFVGAACVFLNSLPGMWVASHIKVGTSHAMVVLLLFFAIGMMVAPVVIGIALGLGATWRWVFGFEAILSAVLALLLTVAPISDIHGRENLRLRQLRAVVGFNPRLFATVLAASLLYIGAEFILNVWLPKYVIDVFDASKSVASQTVALFWLGLVAGRLIQMPLSKRVPASRLLMAGTGIMAVFSLATALSTSLPMAMAMAFLAGLGASASFALILSFSGRFTAWHAGVVYSAVMAAAAIGRIIFPYLVGPVAHSLGFRMAMGMAFVLAGIVCVLSLLLRRVSREADPSRS